MNSLSITARTVLSLALLLQAGAGHAELQGRDLDGNAATVEAYYDTALGITWLADMNYMRTLSQASGGAQGTVDGLMQGYALVPYLNDIHGIDGWRLPYSSPAHGPSFDFTISNNGSTDAGTARTGIGWGTASELGHLFYVTLGNLGYCAPDDAAPKACFQQAGWQPLQNTGPFINLHPGAYWALSPPSPLDGYGHWRINLSTGQQTADSDYFTGYGAYVHDGDVSAVREPPGAALMMMGAALLAAARRCRGGLVREAA